GHGAIEGRTVALIANSRGVIKGRKGGGETGAPKIGGIIYTESAEKVAYFIENADRERIPLLFVQDVSGFMVGTDAEHSGIIRAGARFVEAMATATVPKLVLTVNHASGAGYYAMAGQGFDPDFIVSWPTGRMGVMEGESAVQAVFGNGVTDAENAPAADAMRADPRRGRTAGPGRRHRGVGARARAAARHRVHDRAHAVEGHGRRPVPRPASHVRRAWRPDRDPRHRRRSWGGRPHHHQHRSAQ